MKKFWLLLSTMILAVVLAACGNGGSEEGSGESTEENSEGEAAADFEENDYPSTVTIGTASQGGTYYIWGGGLATLLEDNLDVTSNVEVTGGPVHNIQLLDTDDVQLGMVTEGPLYEGYTGEGEWAEQEYTDIRVIFPMYDTPFNWFSLESTGVDSLEQHEGERVGIGPAGGTPGTYNPIIYDVLGIETGDQVAAGASDMVSQMLDGQLDHIGFSAGLPIAAVVEAETQADINIYGIDGENREAVMSELPYFKEFTIPEGTYDSQEGEIETVAQFNYGVVQKEANSDFVYDLVKAYHENIDHMINTHNSAAEAEDPQVITNNTDYPMHPGAIRYYEEIGVELSEEVYPEEWDGSADSEEEDSE